MKINEHYFRLYAVTDRTWHKQRAITISVRDALTGGATMIQLRETNVLAQIYTNEAVSVKAVCEKFKVPLIIYDNIEVVFGSVADGLHIDQLDVTIEAARAELGQSIIIGKTVQTLEQAVAAEAAGADYLTVAPVFSTEANQGAALVELATLKEIAAAVDIPVAAAGGVSEQNIQQLAGSGIDGVAVSEAIFIHRDAKESAASLRKLIDETL